MGMYSAMPNPGDEFFEPETKSHGIIIAKYEVDDPDSAFYVAYGYCELMEHRNILFTLRVKYSSIFIDTSAKIDAPALREFIDVMGEDVEKRAADVPANTGYADWALHILSVWREAISLLGADYENL